ncbi:hypothetical protein EB796_014587 [Bugula neritina]|uniref:Uncharacterized protein n=1 Tax=Bugula neritina TaxID=10212 RepID=A0A7J7JND2_BUGNE|nr:hypothetical protein EB796_014587 [Bugula neritina]
MLLTRSTSGAYLFYTYTLILTTSSVIQCLLFLIFLYLQMSFVLVIMEIVIVSLNPTVTVHCRVYMAT